MNGEDGRTTEPVPQSLAQAAFDSQHVAAERAARAGGVHAGTGQTWMRKSDNTVWRIAGHKTRTWVLVDDDDTYIEVGLDELADEWTHTGCDHTAACCTTHRTHTSPHMGCVLR